MSQAHHWRLAITPLSPVHMGTGQDYEPTNYVIDGGALYAFDGVAALTTLPARERERLGRLLDGRPSPGLLRDVQRFFFDNRKSLIAVSRQQVRVNETVEAFYGERIGRVAQHEHGGGQVQNRLEIERTAYNPPTGQAILPGSGLKGAIRTALLNALNNGRSLAPDLRRDRQASQKLQEHLFEYRMGQLEKDPMRLVHVADASLRDPTGFATQVLFAVNRKKQPVHREGRELASQAEQQGLYQLLECLPPMQRRAFDGSLSFQDTGDIDSGKMPRYRFRLPEIAVACNTFYRPILEEELKILAKRSFVDPDWVAAIRRLLDGPVGTALNENRAWLQRVGRHSGAESVTLSGVRNIKIMKGRGEQAEYLDHSKTLWLASEERLAQRHLLPFGWLLVEPYQKPVDLPGWSEHEYVTDITTWRNAVRQRQMELLEEVNRIRHREEARRQEEQAALRAATEREVRMQAMTDEARRIEALGELLTRDRTAGRKEAGGELANNLVAALKEASEEWTCPECATLATLAEEIYAYIGWPKKKKKQERKALIEAVRERAS